MRCDLEQGRVCGRESDNPDSNRVRGAEEGTRRGKIDAVRPFLNRSSKMKTLSKRVRGWKGVEGKTTIVLLIGWWCSEYMRSQHEATNRRFLPFHSTNTTSYLSYDLNHHMCPNIIRDSHS